MWHLWKLHLELKINIGMTGPVKNMHLLDEVPEKNGLLPQRIMD